MNMEYERNENPSLLKMSVRKMEFLVSVYPLIALLVVIRLNRSLQRFECHLSNEIFGSGIELQTTDQSYYRCMALGLDRILALISSPNL